MACQAVKKRPKTQISSAQKTTQEKMNKRGFGVIGFPPLSPDVNPIEHFSQHLKQEKVKHNPTSLNTLRDVINDCWKNIKTDVIRKSIDSMPGRIKTVLKEKSGHTKY